MDYEKLTEEELVLKSQSGDDLATNLLLSKYKRVANSYARKFFISSGDTEDLAQTALIAVFNAIRTYQKGKEGIDFGAYAAVCIKNSLKTLVRQDNNKKNSPLKGYLSITNNDTEIDKSKIVSSKNSNPETQIIKLESKTELLFKIKEILSALEFEILQYYLEGYSYQEIADKVGKEQKAVDNTVQRIRKKMKAIKNIKG